jgi:hypothetical protein
MSTTSEAHSQIPSPPDQWKALNLSLWRCVLLLLLGSLVTIDPSRGDALLTANLREARNLMALKFAISNRGEMAKEKALASRNH